MNTHYIYSTVDNDFDVHREVAHLSSLRAVVVMPQYISSFCCQSGTTLPLESTQNMASMLVIGWRKVPPRCEFGASSLFSIGATTLLLCASILCVSKYVNSITLCWWGGVAKVKKGWEAHLRVKRWSNYKAGKGGNLKGMCVLVSILDVQQE